MATQLVCDECGEVIDQTQPFYVVNATKQQIVDGVMTVVEQSVTVDFHEDHLPWTRPEPPHVEHHSPPSPDVPVGPSEEAPAPPVEEPTE